ncbi:hypothetical protein HMPREF3033_01702 [Veillonellaceae bacterium DNF00751]|nr:hypothetical protein HMPREF3033_01702 [Veillonellaceae bacterium DNF00751]
MFYRLGQKIVRVYFLKKHKTRLYSCHIYGVYDIITRYGFCMSEKKEV